MPGTFVIDCFRVKHTWPFAFLPMVLPAGIFFFFSFFDIRYPVHPNTPRRSPQSFWTCQTAALCPWMFLWFLSCLYLEGQTTSVVVLQWGPVRKFGSGSGPTFFWLPWSSTHFLQTSPTSTLLWLSNGSQRYNYLVVRNGASSQME